MLDYQSGNGVGSKWATERLNLDHVVAMLATLPEEAVIDVSDPESCIGQRALRAMEPDATEARFWVDQGKVTYADGTRIMVRADVHLENLVVDLIDISIGRDGPDEPTSNFTVAEIRQKLADWR